MLWNLRLVTSSPCTCVLCLSPNGKLAAPSACVETTVGSLQVYAQVLRSLPAAQRAAALDKLAADRLYAVGATVR